MATELGLLKVKCKNEFDLAYCRHPLTYLMEAADDIAYRMIDFEDGIRQDLIDFEKEYKLNKSSTAKDDNDSNEQIIISPEQILKEIASIDSKFKYSNIKNKSEKIDWDF